MEMEFRARNHDMGIFFPTFQERVNNMLPVTEAATACCDEGSAALALEPVHAVLPATPHVPDADEVQQTLSMIEEQAQAESLEIMQVHSGLNEQRVARLLGLLD